MSELVADCPRCGAKHMTFDLTQENLTHERHEWQQWYEAFCVCRQCKKATIFVLSQNVDSDHAVVHEKTLQSLTVAINRYMNVEGYVSNKDRATVVAPEHVPPAVAAIFDEGARCLAVECFNAAGTMFRLCVDLATRSMLPEGEAEGLNSRTRRDLGLRLPWLFDHGRLPEALRDLSHCIREDGNDGAHDGTLTEVDAEDLLDFTTVLLDRMYTEPKRLELAKERRDRRGGAA